MTRTVHEASRWPAREAAVVVRAVLPRPTLWWPAASTLMRTARRGWWRRAPYLPVPGQDYWRFRLVTAYGAQADGGQLSAADVVAYLRWCQMSRPRRG